MSVSNEFSRPDNEDLFEEMCFALYRRLWNDITCRRVGRSGQEQRGIDILGNEGAKAVGVQCKHYNKTPFTIATIRNGIARAETANAPIEHLLFATTKSSDADLVFQVQELNAERQGQGKFTVSVDSWAEISAHVRMHPEIGRTYIPNFPGSAVQEIRETTFQHLALYREDRERPVVTYQDPSSLERKIDEIHARVVGSAAQGDEEDIGVARILDRARDLLSDCKTVEALAMLEALGDPAALKDRFSKFRWHTNHACVALLNADFENAADEFLVAFNFAPDNEKAQANRAHAFLLKNDPATALKICDESLKQFTNSTRFWALKLRAQQLLGQTGGESAVPESIREAPDMLFARANLRATDGDYRGAFALLKQTLEPDAASLDFKRAVLTEALCWAAHDPIMALQGQIELDARQALTDAIEQLEPLAATLESIQASYVSHELTNNVTASLMLLGREEQARTLAAHFLSRHPLSEGLLRIRIGDLQERRDIDAIRSLTDNYLEKLPPGIVVQLAQVSAQTGDVAWNERVLAAAQVGKLAPQPIAELRALSFQAQWVSGQRTQALAAAQAYLQAHPSDGLIRVIVARMLHQLNKVSESVGEARVCISQLPADAPTAAVLNVADLLFDIREYRAAAELYERISIVPGYDDITRRHLICLVESDQRVRAQSILEQLPAETRALSSLQRIEANLARRMGDWQRMCDITKRELDRDPRDGAVATSYASALYRLNATEELTAYLSTDPVFDDASPEIEFEFAKYQNQAGFGEFALRRVYRLYRTHINSGQIAGYFLGLIVLGYGSLAIPTPTMVGPGSTVYLKSAADTRAIAIDFEDCNTSGSWPELVSHHSPTGNALQGKQIGDKVKLTGGMAEREYEVVGIETVFNFAARKAHEYIAATAVPDGPLRSVRIINDDGELDIEGLTASVRQRSELVEELFAIYKQKPIPLAMLAKYLGTDPITLLKEWPAERAKLFVGFGTEEERDSAARTIKQPGHRYVVDLITLAEIARRNALEASAQTLGRPLVSQSLRAHLVNMIQLLDHSRPKAWMGEVEGKIQFIEVPSSHYDQRLVLLRGMLRFVDGSCDVVPTSGPQEVSEELAQLVSVLDQDSLDAVYLSLERGAVLVSEDGAIRTLAVSVGVGSAIGVQPVLIEACNRGVFTRDGYVDAVVGKVSEGHDFVSFSAEDLLILAKRSPNQISPPVKTVLEAIRSPTLDLVSAIRVCATFVLGAILHLPPKTASGYSHRVLDVLLRSRQQHNVPIRQAISLAVEHGIKHLNRKLKAHEKKLFEDLLYVPKQEHLGLRLTPVAQSVREMLAGKRDRFR